MVARLFTICWILIGIVVISVFTATVTTSLTTLSLNTHEALYGKNLVVYQNGEEFRYGVKTNNNMKVRFWCMFYSFVSVVCIIFESAVLPVRRSVAIERIGTNVEFTRGTMHGAYEHRMRWAIFPAENSMLC